MTNKAEQRLQEIFKKLSVKAPLDVVGGREVFCPADGSLIARIADDDSASFARKISAALVAQHAFSVLSRTTREAFLTSLSDAITANADALATVIMLEGGKTVKEGLVEANGSATTIVNTLKQAGMEPLGNMARCKERPAIGIVGLITSFNFPLVVANWTLAPALLAANGVLWKPSEKTPLTALAYKAVFDKAMGPYADLLQPIIGGRDVGGMMVAHPQVGMISATGSEAMGKGIAETLHHKESESYPPILELGGNNAAVFSAHMDDAHREFAMDAILGSFLGTAGQRCTNTRRILAHASQYDKVVEGFKKRLDTFAKSGAIVSPLDHEGNAYGYGPLIDADSYERLQSAMQQALNEGGDVWGGDRLYPEMDDAYYVTPALAMMPTQTDVMMAEAFVPLLYIAKYEGDVEDALDMVNEPVNSGLVAAIYTQSKKEADAFAYGAQAGHVLINPPKGTGTPAHGMGFGGNKASGMGEILNSADPLAPFTQPSHFRRIAWNNDIVMAD